MVLKFIKGILVGVVIEPDLEAEGNIFSLLMNILPEKISYRIFFDNWFSSLKWMRLLKIKEFLCIFKLNKARWTLVKFRKRKRNVRLQDIYYCFIAAKRLDNTMVCLASTYARITPQNSCRRRNVKNKSKVEVSTPAIVYENNRHIGGIDLVDMLTDICHSHLPTLKWCIGFFWWLFDAGVCNSWLLLRSDAKALTSKDRRTDGLESLRVWGCGRVLCLGVCYAPT